MTDENHDERSNPESGRRRFLRGVGTLGLAGVGLPALSTRGEASDASVLDAFRVTGKEIVRTEITPETVTVHKRKISEDLRKRYGLTPPVLTKTESLERPAPGEDDLPERDVSTVEREWDTYYAKDREWKEYFKGSGEVGAAYHAPVEDQKPYGTWEYEAVDGGYEITAPMNVISERTTEAVADVLTDDGWTTSVVQYDRHAWNSETYQFETQHESAATGTFGFLGRHHLKMWEFEGYVSGSAHVDSSAPHEATSFEDAEQEIEGVFDDASGWYGYEDYYDLDNGGHLDHDGQATKLIDY